MLLLRQVPQVREPGSCGGPPPSRTGVARTLTTHARACSSRNALKVHIKALHTLDRPFKCEVEGCTMTYMTRIDLDRHLKKHQKWDDREEKQKSKALEKRVEKSEKKVQDLTTKLAQFEGTAASSSKPVSSNSAGRLVPVKPGDTVPEGAVAVFVPNASAAGVPLDRLQVVRRPVKRATPQDEGDKAAEAGAGVDAAPAGPLPGDPVVDTALLSLPQQQPAQPSEEWEQDAGAALQERVEEAAAGLPGPSAAGEAPVAPQGSKRKASSDPERAMKIKRKKDCDAKLKEVWTNCGLAAQVPYQSWRRGLSNSEVFKLTNIDLSAPIEKGVSSAVPVVPSTVPAVPETTVAAAMDEHAPLPEVETMPPPALAQ